MAEDSITIKMWAVFTARVSVLYSIIYIGIEFINALNHTIPRGMLVIWLIVYAYNVKINFNFAGCNRDWEKSEAVVWFSTMLIVLVVRLLGTNYRNLSGGMLAFAIIVNRNVFVIAAIILERNLQNVANYLVASLAVADLFVACLVMPLGAVYEISNGWILGPELCDIWTSCDVLCCTASILHLVAIAADRYWTVTNIDYNNLRTPKRVFLMIFCVWFAALIVSLAPQFGWKDPDYMSRIEEQQCMVSQDVAYQIFATCCTFYVPLLVILFLYWKIYLIARKRIQRRTQKSFNVRLTETEYDSTARELQKEQRGKRRMAKREQDVEENGAGDGQPQRRTRKRMKICFGRKSNTANIIAGSEGAVARSVAAIAVDFASLAITREETEFSTSNYDNKSHAGTELTTISSDADDYRTSNANEIITLSQQVASATQQHLIASHLNAITPLAQSIAMGGATSSNQTPGSGGGAGAGGTSPMGGGKGVLSSIANPHQKLAKRRQLLEAKRERKAAQTLAIITGAFVICWLPFFVMALTMSLCKACEIHPAVASLFLWLGYFNSTLNPVIYTIFNPEFRRAFKRILFGRKHAARARSAKI
ncbi:5-hydroxytryptamine receptor 2B isoform X2 [Drosophila nasuta]|uniref:5-hydroxytryptamine receptor 2B isoform X2 n=1 Tax=Drosophila nasuta TaxID=42062 RepID=UPI00295E65F6|nr:5-hydroxytryptamine receptor 2B isoform X2 [Drosophila nasuta]XP_060654516.1 5-hydroxytryptamine receptor 2B isoform X2 [Drosophila nasuta]XP_060654517.1 5-hydroxytryptamine receptor 2B isoform X2 [Drosophila nasuta]XP_060654518.1 5-hydroxytryptamine receptor 2B isoform X2 [Drosophila nasuta]